MSFVTQQLGLGKCQPVHQMKECQKCNRQKIPHGGIFMSPTKWICAECWTKRAIKRG
jgi:hypothetical protein